ncbi:MAG: MFS transporter [Ktedonobacteraceae bacterium]
MSLVDKDKQQTGEDPPDTALTPTLPAAIHDPYSALRFRDFRLVFCGVFLSSIGERMLEVALGWELYERTRSALVLGGVGLVLVIPVILFSLLAGHIIDRFDRKRIVLIAQLLLAVSSVGLTLLSYEHGSILLIYAILLLMGTANAFAQPAQSALYSQIIPDSAFENAATWNSSSWQLASVIGPGLGGLAIILFHSATPVYIITAITALLFVILIAFVRVQKSPARLLQARQEGTWRSIANGLSFLGKTRVLLAAITLDLFAVLLGGATTLLPIFARDILHVGPVGLGWLRAAPSIGAVCIALILAHRPPFKHAGRTLLFAVAGFGLATIVFGLSRSFWLSLCMLCALGALDNISVVIRSTLVLTRTPNEMRGRVSAVNSLFVGASNELGGFESGLTAQLFGPLISVVGGGVGTILIVLCVALLWPEMRHLKTIRETNE